MWDLHVKTQFVVVTDRVSSVLGRDAKSYGKKYLFDYCDDTCWNSDQVLFYIYAVLCLRAYKKQLDFLF